MEKIPTTTLAKYISLASIGTLVEWYDLFVVGVAASLIWPTLFYPTGIGAAALAASISTYGSIFFTRPIGAIIFGHFGDKIGRKTMLIWTLLLSSVGMIGMALTPPFVSIGLLAPILILIFRLIQGIGLGGEYGGAATILIEYTAKTNKRAYYSSFLQATVPLGALFAILGLFLGRTYMTAAEFATIGWRILLGIGAVALIIGGFIRYVLMESPLFQELLKKKEIERSPVTTVLKERWKAIFLLGLSWAYIVTIFAIIYFPTGLSYMAALKIPLGIVYSGLFAGAIGV
ncbi:MFS transporter [Sulfolobus sp. E11-6]|uniref:MFS transporter n=1 Tax=Sulfolobus sp. E11-6 TaxID=2663020 RepID=UPI0012953A05|nr:MFS transporter [Sulfolobus sp. E11-6]QGA68975.1 MFS transporter [Sulfolobus sp. E11-6]